MALLLISHDLAMVGEYCDRIAVMYGGRVVESGAVGAILRQPEHEYTRSLLQAALHIQAVSDEENRRQGERRTRAIPPPHWGELPIPNLPNPLLRIKALKQYYTLESNLLHNCFPRKGKCCHQSGR
jgi:peptide/nickel transport system ATP-binding protein